MATPVGRYRTPIDAVDSAMAELRAGVHGKHYAMPFRSLPDKLAFSSNDFVESRLLKVAINDPSSKRIFVAKFEFIPGGVSPECVVKNTLINADSSVIDMFMALCADNLMKPIVCATEEELTEREEFIEAVLRKHWLLEDDDELKRSVFAYTELMNSHCR
jgi:hypothetical protein